MDTPLFKYRDLLELTIKIVISALMEAKHVLNRFLDLVIQSTLLAVYLMIKFWKRIVPLLR